jgi:ABC-type nitrate/sulfonate/bicarbonate transport system ATPase subunit
MATQLEPREPGALGGPDTARAPATDLRPPATDLRPPAELRAPAADLPGPAVALRGVTRRFARPGTTPLTALEDVSLTVGEGEILGIVGPSGAGKTTLLELVCGLQKPDSGEVIAGPAALMPQRDLLLPWLDALDNACLALRLAGRTRAAARREAAPMLEILGLGGFEETRPDQLSGGMRQRVAFARTLLSGRPVLCLDEPFGALDAITRMELQSWLEEALGRAPRTVLLVTHDVEEAIVLADRLIVLSPRPGRLVAELKVEAARPRSRTDAAVVELRAEALEALR